jgi:energy-coupling factor transporter ATP-binding protein EcfA2
MPELEVRPAPEPAEAAENKPTSLPEAILVASQSLHIWQRDALRRIATGQTIDEKAIGEFAHMAIKEAVKEEVSEAIPLEINHLAPSSDIRDVSLLSIAEVSNVNAISSPKPLKFAPTGLTVVYGGNGSGKSGYAKILQTACFCRHRPDILPNVFATPPITDQSAKLTFQVGTDAPCTFNWNGKTKQCDALQAVHVFDTDSGDVFLTKEEDVAYLPHGLGMFKVLAEVCDAVKEHLEDRRGQLSSRLPTMGKELANTKAGEWFQELNHGTPQKDIQDMTSFVEAEEITLKALIKKVESDPKVLADEIDLKAQTLAVSLLTRLVKIEDLIANDIHLYEEAVSAVHTANQMAIAASKELFLNEKVFPVHGVGADAWRKLWGAAVAFANLDAYPEKEYPSAEAGRCVLCHQPLDQEALNRFESFKAFVSGQAEKELAVAKQHAATLIKQVAALVITQQADQVLFDIINHYDKSLIDDISRFLISAEERKKFIIQVLSSASINIEGFPALSTSPAQKIEELVSRMGEEAGAFETAAQPEAMIKIKNDLKELQAKKWLHDNAEAIHAEVKRKKHVELLHLAEKKAKSRPITEKQKELSSVFCTDQLCKTFDGWLKTLGLTHIKVKLATKPRKGTQCQSLFVCDTTQRNPGVKTIASEGERRAIALAAFLTDISMLPHNSAVVFDDPVSSLDHYFRVSVSSVLSKLAKVRQVVVFTHDVYFLVKLIEECQARRVRNTEYHVLRFEGTPGFCEKDLPFEVAQLEQQISIIGKMGRDAQNAIERSDHQAYAVLISDMRSKMRWVIETTVEEVYICNVVKRYRQSLSSQKGTKDLAVLDYDDCEFIDDLMSKYCYPLHTHGADAPPRFPELNEIMTDIEAIKNRKKLIKKKREVA